MLETQPRPKTVLSRPESGPRTLAEPRPTMLERIGVLNLDWTLLAATIGLIGFSLFVLGAATQNDVPGEPHYFLIRQSIYAVIGIAAMLALARVDYSRFRELRVGLYTAMIVSILAVLAIGSAARGSRRWIEMPFFTFQPSELGKVLLVLALAAFAIDRARRDGSEARRTVRLLAMGALPAFLVILQPDLGTAAVYGVITLAVMWVAGVHWTQFAALTGVAATLIFSVLVLAPALGAPVLQPYQQERLTAFLDPSGDPGDSSYQINQALIAIGSGGKTGRGSDATQTESGFLPERHTDFIFAVVGERYGFLGAAFLLSLYALLIWRALRILTLSKNLYGSMIAGGIAAMLMFHLFVNVGMNVGIAPVTGIPLPLMSFGGSSIVVSFLAIGLLQSIYVQSQRTSASRARTLAR